MTTSMFLEIPNISENRFSIQKSVISKNFRKLIDQYDQKGIQFLPQNSRDFIVFAARELHRSNWQSCFNNICKVKVFQKMSEFKNGSLKSALEKAIKETALKIYIIENQNSLESLKLDQSGSFQMDKRQTLQLVSKLIIKKVIAAKICMDSETIFFEGRGEGFQVGMLPQSDRQEMEFLQQQHLDQINKMVVANDRFMDLLVNQSYQSFIPQHHNRR